MLDREGVTRFKVSVREDGQTEVQSALESS